MLREKKGESSWPLFWKKRCVLLEGIQRTAAWIELDYFQKFVDPASHVFCSGSRRAVYEPTIFYAKRTFYLFSTASPRVPSMNKIRLAAWPYNPLERCFMFPSHSPYASGGWLFPLTPFDILRPKGSKHLENRKIEQQQKFLLLWDTGDLVPIYLLCIVFTKESMIWLTVFLPSLFQTLFLMTTMCLCYLTSLYSLSSQFCFSHPFSQSYLRSYQSL